MSWWPTSWLFGPDEKRDLQTMPATLLIGDKPVTGCESTEATEATQVTQVTQATPSVPLATPDPLTKLIDMEELKGMVGLVDALKSALVIQFQTITKKYGVTEEDLKSLEFQSFMATHLLTMLQKWESTKKPIVGDTAV
jgi:hypothetical protein